MTGALDSPGTQRLLAVFGLASALAVVPMLFVAEHLARRGVDAAIWLVPAAAVLAFACGLGVRKRLLKVLLFTPGLALALFFGEMWI